MASPSEIASTADDLGEEIARLAMFLVHLDGYWQRAQRRGLSDERRRLIEGALITAHGRVAELTAPLAQLTKGSGPSGDEATPAAPQ